MNISRYSVSKAEFHNAQRTSNNAVGHSDIYNGYPWSLVYSNAQLTYLSWALELSIYRILQLFSLKSRKYIKHSAF